MNLSEYKATIAREILPRTSAFLLRSDQVCLGLKKRGFGKGYYLGIGGKVEKEIDSFAGDTDKMMMVRRGACREIREEVGVTVKLEDLQFMGSLNFYFPHVPDESWNEEVYIFTVNKWAGEPIAQKDQNGEVEIEPEWVPLTQLPFDKMWDDARYWLPLILKDRKVNGEFLFDENLLVVDHYLI
ncbi:8-oxo-dGTP diphosphatase [Candidatus Roizmanbacteria bacterium]|nr:8-oxo-dGTP diphosphatase [Candidatus Roizmanbacteria bacterium]